MDQERCNHNVWDEIVDSDSTQMDMGNTCTCSEIVDQIGSWIWPRTNARDANCYSLRQWVYIKCGSYIAIQRGERPERNFSNAEIKRVVKRTLVETSKHYLMNIAQQTYWSFKRNSDIAICLG